MISDCCHSGSMLDHPQQQISGNKDPNAPPGVDAMNPMDILGMFFREAPVRRPHLYTALVVLSIESHVLVFYV